MKYCPKCGHEIPDGSVFCNFCGAKIEVEHQTNSNTDNTKEWYCIIKGDKKGPYSKKQIGELVDFDHIDAYTQVWKEGMANYEPLFKTELVNFFEEVPSNAKGELDNKWFWMLAIIPLATNIIVTIIATALSTNLSILNIVLVIALNCLFIGLDCKALKNAGYETKSWFWLGLILVPVYLFIRAAKTNKNFAPPIIWCIIEVAIIVFSLSVTTPGGSLTGIGNGKPTDKTIANCCWQIFQPNLKYPYTASLVKYGDVVYDAYGRIICKLVYSAQNGVGNYITDDVWVCLQSCTSDGRFEYLPGVFWTEDNLVILKSLNGWGQERTNSTGGVSMHRPNDMISKSFAARILLRLSMENQNCVRSAERPF